MAYTDILRARLLAYQQCELAILNGAQEYQVEDKRFRRADLKYVQSMIAELEREIAGRTPNIKRIRSQRVLIRRT